MQAAEVTALIAELFAAIKALSGYPIPERMPEVHITPLAQMQRMVCQGPCQVKAFYLPERGVFINEAMDLQNDIQARSVLLHELVHHVQQVSGKFEIVADKCDRWYSKELEAYAIQNKYLRAERSPHRYFMDSLPNMCGNRDSDATSSGQ